MLAYFQDPAQDVEQDRSNKRCNDCFLYRHLFRNGRSEFVTCGIGIDNNINGRETTPLDIKAEFRSDASGRRSGGLTFITEYPSSV